MKKALILLMFAFCGMQAFGSCSPILGLGSIQLFDNNGKPLPNGVLYSFQAGTSTQQQTFTDSTCLVPNNNPITMSSGGRATVWLSGGLTYKFVACLQNDGAACAPADVLFSVDQVPGGIGASASFVGTFISGSANPATSGILELASTDTICWRNAANSANLCISKDTSDVLAWAGGDMKFPEINCTATASGFDYLCADNSLHRWTMFNNGGTKTQVVGAGVDINNSDQVTGLHFGSQAAPLSSVALTAGQSLIWNGSNIVGAIPSIAVANNGGTGTTLNTLTKLTGAPSTAIIAATTDTGGIVGITCAGAGTAGTATICQIGATPCVFDGATTAGDYIQISSTTPGNCHDAGAGNAASGQLIGRVLSTNGGGGTYTIDLFPPEIKPASVAASSITTCSGCPIAIPNSSTTLITKAVTMPASGCPCRAFVSYSLYLDTANSGQVAALVDDGTNKFATAEVLTTGAASDFGLSSSSFSTGTYASGASITFTLKAAATNAGNANLHAGVGPSLTGAQSSWMNVTIFPSN